MDISKQRKDLSVGSMDWEDDWEQDALGDSCEDNTESHHDEEVLFIVECSVEVEVEELVSDGDTAW